MRSIIRRLSTRSATAVNAALPKAPELELKRLCARYGRKIIFSDLSCTIGPGMTMSVVGPSGSGKTTLIRSIGLFTGGDLQLSGEVKIGGEQVRTPGPRIGVVLQNAPVFEHLTVWDNVSIGSRVRAKANHRAMQAMCFQLLSGFGLAGAATQRAETLSGGQRQRLALAMVLANRPEVLLLDEPFGALDAITRRQLQDFYWRHVHGTVTALFVTHDIEEALLVGNVVRVGVGPTAAVLDIEKDGQAPRDWELTPKFGDMRVQLIQALEATANIGD